MNLWNNSSHITGCNYTSVSINLFIIRPGHWLVQSEVSKISIKIERARNPDMQSGMQDVIIKMHCLETTNWKQNYNIIIILRDYHQASRNNLMRNATPAFFLFFPKTGKNYSN